MLLSVFVHPVEEKIQYLALWWLQDKQFCFKEIGVWILRYCDNNIFKNELWNIPLYKVLTDFIEQNFREDLFST